MEIPEEYKKNLYYGSLVFLIVVSLYFAVRFLSEFKSYRMMGDAYSSITLSGHGEVNAVPDIANVYFTIRKEKKTVKEAQDEVAAVEKKALDFLKENSVEEKDFKASNASFYPKYEWIYEKVVCVDGYSCPPNNGKSVLTGYEASESITVKIRNTEDVGKIIQGLGTLGVSDLNGPNYAIDKEDDLKAEARKMAIDDAREKAEVLAKDLGVDLGKITSFSESGGGYPPIFYAKESMMASDAGGAPAPAVIPKGENTISSDVTITYEIK